MAVERKVGDVGCVGAVEGRLPRHHRLVPLPLCSNSIVPSRPARRSALARYSPWLSRRLPHRGASQFSRPLGGTWRLTTLNASIDNWAAGDAYETFMGRWSRRVADDFLDWLAHMPRANWLEVGCGTGALTKAVRQRADPASVVACDPSPMFVSFARNSIEDGCVTFLIAGADDLPRRHGGFDVIVSGLVLNFLPQPPDAVRSMRDRIRRGGLLAAYVWDYAEGMQFLRTFWDEAVALDPSAAPLDEALRFPICQPDALIELFEQAGRDAVTTEALQVPTVFPSFDAYWTPFLGATGPGPSYIATLNPDAQARLRLSLERRLVRAPGASISLTARAFGVRGLAPLEKTQRAA